MLQKNLSLLFERDLKNLKKEIEAYTNENDLWTIQESILNSGGNLCLHLIGNLKHFVGKILGNISYERKRDKEFSDKNILRYEILTAIDETIVAVKSALENLQNDDLEKTFPVKVFEQEMTTEVFLLHLYGHLSYHLGQINYHRRLLNK